MRLKEKLDQHRRDFRAVYECEHCGHEEIGKGYDDANFHQNVIPSWLCPKCEKRADGPSSSPDVPAGVVL